MSLLRFISLCPVCECVCLFFVSKNFKTQQCRLLVLYWFATSPFVPLAIAGNIVVMLQVYTHLRILLAVQESQLTASLMKCKYKSG